MRSQIFIDIGSSKTKWKCNEIYSELNTVDFDFDILPSVDKVWISNVSKRLFEFDEPNFNFIKSQQSYKSLVNSYKEPGFLGSDRWLAMIAAYEYSQENDFIVIDIGTAVTLDVVNRSGVHQGGLIFPGLYKIRQTFDLFPVTTHRIVNSIGQSTKDAWSIGTMALLVNSINFKIEELKKEFLNFSYEYHKNIVLDGLEFYADIMG